MSARVRIARIAATLTVLLAPGVVAVPVGADPAPGTPVPGALVSVRTLPAGLSVPGAVLAEKLEYRTQWRSGESTVATGALFVPDGEAPAEGWPVIAWAHGTTGVGDDCSLTTATHRSDLEKRYLAHWLGRGYAVVSADYPGLGSPGLHRYLDGPSAANSVVDIVRAAHRTQVPLSDRWMVVGHSQGGHAALHTATVATERAPELDFRGTVATGAPANLEHLFPAGGPGFPDPGLTGLVSFSGYILAGIQDAYPHVDVDGYLTPQGREVVDRAETLCYDDLEASVRDVSVGDLVAVPMSQGDLPAAFEDYLAVPTGGYDRPVLLAHGVHDVMVPLPLYAALAAGMRNSGADVQYRVYPAGHFTLVEQALGEVTEFVARLLRSRESHR